MHACPLSVLKHGLHSWIAAYLCFSAFASIHGSVPNSNSKLLKRSYLAAFNFIQHVNDLKKEKKAPRFLWPLMHPLVYATKPPLPLSLQISWKAIYFFSWLAENKSFEISLCNYEKLMLGLTGNLKWFWPLVYLLVVWLLLFKIFAQQSSRPTKYMEKTDL